MMINDIMTPCVRLMETDVPDGLGGFSRAFEAGEAFDAALILQKASDATEAGRKVPTERYTLVVGRGLALPFHAVFQRLSDGAVFRVTAATGAMAAPACAGAAIERGACERWDGNE